MEKIDFIKELSSLTPQQMNSLILTKGKESRMIPPFVLIENHNNNNKNLKNTMC